jgi:hypothetical protein
MELMLTALAVSLVTLTVFAALLLPTFCEAKVKLVGVTDSAGCDPLTVMVMVVLK